MKLKHWIDENVPSYKRGAWADKVPDGLHVIGPCVECVSYSEIKNSKTLHTGYCNLKGKGNIPEQYGCIYFKGK